MHGEIYGNVFDHHAVVYHYTSGVRLYAYCRTIDNYGPKVNPCDLEHVALFNALRSGTVIDDGDRMIRSTLVALMGQFSCYTGKEVTWEEINKSDFTFAPKPEDIRADMEPPVKKDADGIYPVFTPGVTKLL